MTVYILAAVISVAMCVLGIAYINKHTKLILIIGAIIGLFGIAGAVFSHCLANRYMEKLSNGDKSNIIYDDYYMFFWGALIFCSIIIAVGILSAAVSRKLTVARLVLVSLGSLLIIFATFAYSYLISNSGSSLYIFITTDGVCLALILQIITVFDAFMTVKMPSNKG